jgi:hypothetical protein
MGQHGTGKFREPAGWKARVTGDRLVTCKPVIAVEPAISDYAEGAPGLVPCHLKV